MKSRFRRSGFTIVELIVVVAIIGILVSMTLPRFGRMVKDAQSVTCMNNLRQVGVAVLNYMGDNDNDFPVIEPNPNDPVYTDQDADGEYVEAKPMLEALQPYGLTEGVLKCPTDLKAHNYFAKQGSSYQWRIFVDGENALAPKIYGGRRGYGVRVVNPARVTLAADFEPIHSGRMNRVYGDGHVSRPN